MTNRRTKHRGSRLHLGESADGVRETQWFPFKDGELGASDQEMMGIVGGAMKMWDRDYPLVMLLGLGPDSNVDVSLAGAPSWSTAEAFDVCADCLREMARRIRAGEARQVVDPGHA